MKVFVVYCHPESRSFNRAMFNTACVTLKDAGCEVRTTDLHALKFDPRPGRDAYKMVKDPEVFKQQIEELYATEQHAFADFIETEIRKMEWCELMIWQFPMWWFGLPATLKGWVDRVFAMGRVYDGKHLYKQGRFAGKRVLLSLTTGAPESAYVEGGMNGDIGKMLYPISHGMLPFVGFSVLNPHVVYAPAHQSEERREEELRAYAAYLRTLLPAPITVP